MLRLFAHYQNWSGGRFSICCHRVSHLCQFCCPEVCGQSAAVLCAISSCRAADKQALEMLAFARFSGGNELLLLFRSHRAGPPFLGSSTAVTQRSAPWLPLGAPTWEHEWEREAVKETSLLVSCPPLLHRPSQAENELVQR